ncbi:MAG: hypothetical protein IJX62_09595 [Clostridia bacterium]|nr:hypothetical protein [Clostridia bacterium]
MFDGGQGLESASIDAHHLYNQLREVADENGIEDIVVSAWVITHAHQDHYGFSRVFFPTYKNNVQVREFWYNGVSGNGDTEVKKLMTNNYPNTPIRQLTLGEKITLSDVVVEVMLTPEALVADDPDAISQDFNNSSLVLKLTIGTKTVLMTGDATIAAWDWMASKYPATNGVSALKSDILQIPHHGSKTAGTNAGYDLVDADTLIYPAGSRLYERCVNSSYTSNYQASTVYAIERTATKHGDTSLNATDLTTLLTKDYFYLAGEYLGTETDLSTTRQCFIVSDVDYSATTEMKWGASVRIVPKDELSATMAESGIRFLSTVPKATLDAADALVANEDLSVASYSFGTLIFKASLLDEITGPISAAALDAADALYVDIPAVNGIQDNSDGSKTLFAALVKIKESNYSTAFAAVSYIEYRLDNGATIRTYATFDREDNVRSITEVAKAALADTSPEKITDRLVNGFYYNVEIAVGETYYIKNGDNSFTEAIRGESDSAVYSPYTYQQRAILREYLKPNAGTWPGYTDDDKVNDPWDSLT